MPEQRVMLGIALVVLMLGAGAGCSSLYADGFHGSAGYGPGYPSYRYGSIFYAGDYAFRVGYAKHDRYGGHYIRSRALSYSRRNCGRYCYSNGGFHYHHRDCRHVGRYMSRYGYKVKQLIGRYGPRY